MAVKFTPTRIYIKKHLITNMRYLGKSTQLDIDRYHGSGTYWKRHIKHHGLNHVITEWTSDWFYHASDISEFALAISELFSVVDSDMWANLKLENGLDGGLVGMVGPNRGKTVPQSVRDKISRSRRGQPAWNKGIPSTGPMVGHIHTEEAKIKMRTPRSDEFKLKISQANRGKKHWTNGIINRFSADCPGDSFWPGRTIHKNGTS